MNLYGWAFVIIGILVIAILITYNNLVKQSMKVKQARSGIDVYLKQRFDLIPNLVECVKKYTQYEKEILEELTRLRETYNSNKDLEIGSELNNKFNNVIAKVENYPELKADEQFLQLEKNLVKIESQLQAARRLYNMEVTNFNTSINVFPKNIIASCFGFKEEKLFEIEDSKERDNIDIKDALNKE